MIRSQELGLPFVARERFIVKIGITFDVKPKTPLPVDAPDDLYEEFDSPDTIKAIAAALTQMGHTPIELGNGRELLQALLACPPDLIFNFAEGSGISRNREARVPAVCEMLDIPHTGSDVLTLALCLDKDLTRRIVQDAGVTVPKGILLTPPKTPYDGAYAEFPALVSEAELPLPLLAKPVCEGSSKGVRSKCLIERAEDIGPVVVSLWNDYKQPVLLEEFIEGDEVTVGLVGNDPARIIGAMRIVPKVQKEKFVYSLEVKRDWTWQVQYECPAQLPAATLAALETAALSAYDILGIRDIARIDFRIRDGVPYFIEANPLPGLNPETGDLLLICKAMGVSHADLIAEIVSSALARYGQS